ncbi:MAG: hypothetical protein ACOYM2_13890 [Rectinemataceae bacterium]
MHPSKHGFSQGGIDETLFQEEPDCPLSPELLENVAGPDRNKEEAVMAIEAPLKH